MYQTFKSKVQNLRKNAGYTQKSLASYVGLSTLGYQQYEYGQRIPNARIAIRIAKALHTTVEALWSEKY